jgi:hypothetical protein
VEVNESGKHIILIKYSNNYRREKFYSTGQWPPAVTKSQTIGIQIENFVDSFWEKGDMSLFI